MTLLPTEGSLMYDRDRPESPTFLDVLSFVRMAREESRSVLLETAGVVCGHLSSAAVGAAVALGQQSRKLRTRADELAPPAAVPTHWHVNAPDLVETPDDEMHRAAERAAAMSRHPSAWTPDT